MLTRQIDEFAIDTFFAANEVTLKFNKNISAAKGIDERGN